MTYQYDPQVEPFLKYAPPLSLSNIQAARELLHERTQSLPPFAPAEGIELRKHSIDGSESETSFQVLCLQPKKQEPAATLVWFHGGGFVSGEAKDSLPFLQECVRYAGIQAISVEYSLAPEQQFPVQLQQGLDVLKWLGTDAGKSLPLAIGGQSAGGALALGLALKMRDDHIDQNLRQLLLDIPVVNNQQRTLSAREYTDTLIWNSTNARYSWEAYLSKGSQQSYAVPALAETYSGLPPTTITANQFDPLRDETFELARRMAHDNVLVDFQLFAGTFHGSAGIAPNANVSLRQRTFLVHALEKIVLTEGKSH